MAQPFDESTPHPPRAIDSTVSQWALTEVRRVVMEGLRGHRARVMLFGSWAKGCATALSDIDVAVLADQPLPPGLMSELRERLDESRVPYRVDLVDLADADEGFRSRVLTEGVPWTD
jgi:predicted nucleotidyltransferase